MSNQPLSDRLFLGSLVLGCYQPFFDSLVLGYGRGITSFGATNARPAPQARRRRASYSMGPPNGNVTPAVARGYLSMLARRSNLRSLRNMTHWRRGTGAWEGIR